ncbi:glycosyltransferase [Nocardioides currus]|uniref:Glycosyl transferase family 1 n=1 Tax=Nocardioides currus TaxID=2133958 RepID=A0A2R7YYU2_9ACTN|nr:glycosyltransferase [Nocardioides currus]PUA81521.1 glycosyl transferase family 1 [Nocardioides currus]
MPETVFLAANNGDLGGGEQMLLRTAAAVRDLDREAVVVAPATPGDVVAAARAEGLEAVAVPGEGRRGYLRGLRRWDRTRDGLLWCHGLVPALATAGHRRRVVHLHQLPRSRAQWAALAVARRGALTVLTPSHTLSRGIVGSRALPNWTDDPPAAPRPVRADGLRVGFLGRLSTDKGLDVLADAVLARPTATLRVAGDDRWVAQADLEPVRRSLAALGERATILGHVTPADLFRSVDVAVFPSRVPESFGLVVAEAMAAGVPFVVSDAGALPEVAGPDHPWVSPAGDVAALAAIIEAIDQSGPGEISKITTAARLRWDTEYSPAAGRERVRRLLEEVGSR